MTGPHFAEGNHRIFAARLFLATLLLLPTLCPAFGQSAEAPAAVTGALPLTIELLPTGIERLDNSLLATSNLRRLAEPAPVDAFGLVARAGAEPAVLEEVLRAEGYWGGLVEIRLAGQPLGTPGLAEQLAASGAPVAVQIKVTPGPVYRLRQIGVRAAEPAEQEALAAIGPPPGLAAGDAARAGAVLDAEAGLIGALRMAGHPLAAVTARDVIVDHDAKIMDVAWTLSPGPRARFATPEVTGSGRVNPHLLARLAGRLDDRVFDPTAVERTRRDFLQLGVFDTVRARTGARLDEAGRLPVTFATTDRPRNAAGISLAYETNYGPTGRIYYERRNVFGNAERLRLEIEGSRLGLGTEDSNARIAANFRRPALFDGATTLVVDAQALRERLKAYDRDAVVLAATLEHPFADRWVLQAGPVLDFGRVGRDGQLDRSNLVGVLVGLRFDTTDSVLDPRSGIRASATVIPYTGFDGSDGFIRAVGTLRTYFDLRGDGGSVVALRGTLGSITGAERGVPLDKRFYSGGGGSVRGVSYQSIGPRDAQGRPEGGVSLAEASVELRQRLRGSFGMVAFLDAGTVGQHQFPDGAELRMGAGLGIRYATAIGPLRLDLAIPLRQRAGDESYGLYVGLGQSF